MSVQMYENLNHVYLFMCICLCMNVRTYAHVHSCIFVLLPSCMACMRACENACACAFESLCGSCLHPILTFLSQVRSCRRTNCSSPKQRVPLEGFLRRSRQLGQSRPPPRCARICPPDLSSRGFLRICLITRFVLPICPPDFCSRFVLPISAPDLNLKKLQFGAARRDNLL